MKPQLSVQEGFQDAIESLNRSCWPLLAMINKSRSLINSCFSCYLGYQSTLQDKTYINTVTLVCVHLLCLKYYLASHSALHPLLSFLPFQLVSPLVFLPYQPCTWGWCSWPAVWGRLGCHQNVWSAPHLTRTPPTQLNHQQHRSSATVRQYKDFYQFYRSILAVKVM